MELELFEKIKRDYSLNLFVDCECKEISLQNQIKFPIYCFKSSFPGEYFLDFLVIFQYI